MSNWQTVLQIRENLSQKRSGADAKPGPYLTISRKYGCGGLTLGLLLAEILNENAPPGKVWKVYGKEVLEQLARETNLAMEMVEELRCRQPRLVVDFLRSLFGRRIPSGYEIRNRITDIVRGLAFQGYTIIVGQGGGGATVDIENGLSLRLEAPTDWCVQEICKRMGCTVAQGKILFRNREKERAYLRKIYAMRFPRDPAFDLVYDNSRFSHTEIAQHVVSLMKIRHMI